MLALQDPRGHQVQEDLVAYQELKVNEVYQVTKVCQVSLEKRGNMDPLELDFRARRGLKASVESLEPQDYLESQEDQDRMARLEKLVHLDKRVNLDGVFQALKVHRAGQESLVSQELRAVLVPQVSPGQKDRQDLQDLRVLKVKLDLQDHLV